MQREPSLAMPPVENSDTSLDWSVHANSRTQTQTAQPIVSAKPLGFKNGACERYTGDAKI